MSASEERRLTALTREALVAALLMAWRIACYPVAGLWKDWVFLLCAFWLFSLFWGRAKAWPFLLGALMTALFVLHSSHQIPHTVAVFRALR